MKKLLCLLLILSLCLTAAACGAPPEQRAAEPAQSAPPDAAPAGTFPPAFLTQQAVEEVSEALLSECPDLAVTGKHVWRCTHGQILCLDSAAGEEAALLPLSALLEEGETPELQNLAAWSGESVLLCLTVTTAAGQRRTELFELGLDGGAVTVRGRTETGDRLDPLFGEGADWLEIDMVSNARRLFFSALDQAFVMHFYVFTPETGAFDALGERDFSEFLAVLPCGEDMLIAGPNLRDETVLELTRLSLADGSTELTDSIRVDSALRLNNFAWDGAENRLYYTVDSVLYAVTPNSGEAPRAVGRLDDVTAMFRLGALAGKSYFCHGVKGELLSCPAQGELSAVQLRVLDTQGIGLLTEAARDFGVMYPAYTVSIREGIEEAELPAALLNAPAEYDAWALSLDSAAWRALCEAELAADLGDSELLAAVAADMPPGMRAALVKEGCLLALPLTVDSMSLTLNLTAAEELTGRGRDQLPTDWRGFLELLRKLAAEGKLLDKQAPSLYSGATVGEFRELLLGWIMQDYLLWAGKEAGSADRLKKGLLPILKAYDGVDWTRLGLAEDSWDGGGSIQGFGGSMEIEAVTIAPGAEGAGFIAKPDGAAGGVSEEGLSERALTAQADADNALLSDSFVEIAVLDMADDAEFWPLSIQAGGQRLVPQTMTLICVNPRSPNREAALRYVEYLWRKMDITAKMTLCRSLNEPVVNPYYEEDLVWLENQMADMDRAIAREDKPTEKKLLELQRGQLKSYLERYRKNAVWAASEDSISLYRGLEDSLTPTAVTLWEDSALDDAMLDFLDGLLTPKQYVRRLGELLPGT